MVHSAQDTSIDPRVAAQLLVAAHGNGRTLDVTFTDEYPLSLGDAYAIQREVTASRLARSERIVGWRLGYTSNAMRVQMGVAGPNMGPLTDAMVLSGSGGAEVVVPTAALQPRAEPEIALVLSRPLEPGCTVDDVRSACTEAYACLEIVDSVWTGYRFRLEDNTADGASAGWVVLGDRLPKDNLARERVTLVVNGFDVAHAHGAAAGGDPALAVVWLAQEVVRRYGRTLQAGDLLITGGLTAARPLTPGTRVEAQFSSGARVRALRTAQVLEPTD